MKFSRNARIFQNRLDAAPFVSVLFLLVIFVMLGSLVYTQGVRLELPMADDVSGTDQPSISLVVGANGAFYFQNQLIEEPKLVEGLRQAVANSPVPLTLMVRADKRVSYDMLLHISTLAHQAGITNALLVALPRPAGPSVHSAP